MSISQAERVSVVETKVENLSEKVEELKAEVRENHESIKNQLMQMANNSSEQHAQLARKIGNLERAKNKLTWMVAGAVALSGIVLGHLDKILAFLK